MPDRYDISVRQGCDVSLTLNLRDDNGQIVVLSGMLLSGRVKTKYSDTGVKFNLNPTIINAASGLITISVPATGTANCPVGKLYYDILMVSGTLTSPVLYGDFDVSPTVYGDA